MILGLFLLVIGLDWMGRLGKMQLLGPTCNSGIALGVRVAPSLLWLGIVLALSISVWGLFTAKSGAVRLAWAALLVGGGLNAVDRALSGCVHDYLHLPFFPSFNLADSILFLGVVYLFGHLLRQSPHATPYVR